MPGSEPVLCVYCRLQPVDPRWRPFCSERCHLLDLAHWLDGDYRVEGPADGAPPDTEPDDPEATDLQAPPLLKRRDG